MSLRFVLVSLVVGLGFEVPGGSEVSAWVRAGYDWLQTLSATDTIATTTPESAPKTADDEFAGIVGGMAKTFAADLARADTEPELEGWDFALVVASPAPANVVFNAIVDDMANRFAADLARNEQPATGTALVLDTPAEDEAWGAEEVEPVAPESPSTSITQADRLATAVQLTQQAASAWADLLGASTR